MSDANVWEKLDRLRIELVELAFTLECRGRLDAADVAMTTSARVGELCDEFAGVESAGGDGRREAAVSDS
jgi:hypothetical protein